ncbi:MAG TPA: alkaline phosphatase family protein [Terriglobales bacterium]|nr:alkaline phosphatase family protein [Terriglobales bacterium]
MKISALGLLLLSSIMWAQVPQSHHVWIVTEENHSYEVVIGNPKMPYYNSLAAKYGLANAYYSEEHNSISALMWLQAGQPITGNNTTTSCYSVNNLARQLIMQGYKWRSYQEDLPYAGFSGTSYANYVRRHNPIIDFTDTCAAGQAENSVPYTQLETDIKNHTTPNYAYITPNLTNDAHNGTLAAADLWLSEHVPAILALPEFQPGGDGILFIVWDEADLKSDGYNQDSRCTSTLVNNCGGRVATLVIGPQVKPGYKSSVRYDHANLLRTVCDAMGLDDCPGAAAVANPMSDFFNAINIATPFPNSQVASPVHIQATTSNSSPVSAVQVYVDNALKYHVKGNSLDVRIPMTIGKHYVVVQSWDTAGGIHKRGMNLSVEPEAVVVTKPSPASVVAHTVQIGATASGRDAVTKMQVYLDGDSQFQSSGNSLNTSLPLSSGNHTIAVQASVGSGNLITNKFSVTAASPSISIISPAANSSFHSPMQISTLAIDPTPITSTQVYVDNQLAYQVSGIGVQASLQLSVGTHSIVVQEWNAAGVTYKKAINVNVTPIPITFSSPKASTVVNSPVTISAAAPAGSPINTMQIYIDSKLAYSSSGKSASNAFKLGIGQHSIVAKGWDAFGNSWSSRENITVK